jgi:heme A synthase
MENAIFYAHSGLRFLVLLAAVIAAAVMLWKWSSGRAFDRQSRASMAVFTGTLDLQIVLGIATVLVRPFYGALIGHLVMMAAAALAAHGISVYGRKQADPRRAHMLSLVAVALALLLIVAGIMSIRPSPFYMTGDEPAAASS